MTRAHLSPLLCIGALMLLTAAATAIGSLVDDAPISIAPAESIQSVVDAHPGATAFLIKAGVHRLQTVRPKAGNAFIGEPGAVLSGARVLTAFQRAGPYWFATGQRQTGSTTAFGKPPHCDAAHPRCDHPEDLFVDNRPLRHVGALESLTSGSWYFDYVADRIYMADDPRGHLVETSVASHAIFANGVTGVTIRGLVIEKFANPGQMGAVHADGAVSWRIEGNEIRLNHGAGITLTVSTSCQLTDNRIHDNGQLGIGAWNSEHLLVDRNEISRNNFAGFDTSWEGGGTKFSWSRELIVRSNFVHHNWGKGLWTDGDNLETLYEGNTTNHNTEHGIFHEISYAAIIRNNISMSNGWHGIVVASSPNVDIYGNSVGGNGRTQIFARQDFSGRSGRYGPLELSNLNVHDNSITANDGGAAGLMPQMGARGDASYYAAKHNRFVHNTYDLRGAPTSPFIWLFRAVGESQWRAHGQDVTGTFRR